MAKQDPIGIGSLAMQLSDASPAAAIAMPDAPRPPPAWVSPGRGGRPAEGGGASLAEASRLLIEDHERIARGLNDIVVRRIFSAGLDLQAALTLISDQHLTGTIEGVLGELDLAIRDLRDTDFDR
jgi:hypothetical protein